MSKCEEIGIEPKTLIGTESLIGGMVTSLGIRQRVEVLVLLDQDGAPQYREYLTFGATHSPAFEVGKFYWLVFHKSSNNQEPIWLVCSQSFEPWKESAEIRQLIDHSLMLEERPDLSGFFLAGSFLVIGFVLGFMAKRFLSNRKRAVMPAV
jgi:hypothetical protein